MKFESKKRKKKNYMILAILYLVVIFIVLYLASWYNTYQEFKKDIPVLRDVVSEITTVEVSHYVMENPSCVLYLCVASSSECRSFENSFKREILKNSWQTNMTYIDLNNMKDKIGYINTLIKTYGGSTTISETPVFLALRDGKIDQVLSGTTVEKLKIEEAKKFMERYQTGE